MVEVTSFVRGCPLLCSREHRGRRLCIMQPLWRRTTHAFGVQRRPVDNDREPCQVEPPSRSQGAGPAPARIIRSSCCRGRFQYQARSIPEDGVVRNQRDPEADRRGCHPSVSVVDPLAQGMTSPLALDPKTRIDPHKVETGMDGLGCRLERDEHRAPDDERHDERLVSDSKSRAWNKLGTIDVGVDQTGPRAGRAVTPRARRGRRRPLPLTRRRCASPRSAGTAAPDRATLQRVAPGAPSEPSGQARSTTCCPPGYNHSPGAGAPFGRNPGRRG